MTNRRLTLATVIAVSAIAISTADSAEVTPPKSLDPRLKVELYAEHPQVVTPTGIDIDHRGRVWVIESNTHHVGRREDYKGHDSDRVLIFSGRDEHGRAENVTTFTDGLVHGMSIAVRPDGAVYVATRKEVLLFRDTDGDDKADTKKRIVHLDTPGDYPHNGLAGFAFDPLGWMYIGMGENLGADYKLIGSDGSSHSGGAEGGNVFRCRPDGSKLTRFATGFWNPHASCFDTFGRMFTVDNDPDSRPPCRLLHTIRGGDYGYRYRNGRRGVHPFTAWNGELPGTLPMVAGTGEAPSGIVAYESDGFPEEYIGSLLVGSWGDHRIDRFQLKPRGTSFTSKAEPLIVGGENFRPVGLAVAPDGSLYFSDWVLKDYPVHGKGRIWRVSAVEEPQREVVDVATIPDRPVKELTELLSSKRIEVRRAAAKALSTAEGGPTALTAAFSDANASRRTRVEVVWAFGRTTTAAEFYKLCVTDLLLPQSNRALRIDEVDTTKLAVQHELIPSVADWSRIIGDALGTGMACGIGVFILSGQPYIYKDKLVRMGDWSDPTFPLVALSLADHNDIHDTHTANSVRTIFDAVFQHDDPFVFSQSVQIVKNSFTSALLEEAIDPQITPDPRARLGYFLALRQKDRQRQSIAEAGLSDPSPAIRRAAVQWIAEEDFQDLRPNLEELLSDGEMTTDLFEATLAALAILDGIERDGDFKTKIKNELPGSQYVLQMVRDESKTPALRARALRVLDPGHSELNEKLLTELLALADPVLTREVVRTLQASPVLTAARLLRGVIADQQQNPQTRAEAIAGLAAHPIDPASRELLTKTIASDNPYLKIEALRSLRRLPSKEFDTELKVTLTDLISSFLRAKPDEITEDDRDRAEQLVRTLTSTGYDVPPKLRKLLPERPRDAAGWLKVLDNPGDPAAGRRVFFHSASAGCYRCHTVEGRGGAIGPDLSTIARTLDREKLVKSILDPSADIAPQYTAWLFVMDNGKSHTGMILRQDHEGEIEIGTADGTTIKLNSARIEDRSAEKTSIMPEKLIDQLTVREFRDLITYLESLK